MNEVTETVLKEWARRVNIVTLRLLPPSSNKSPGMRREAALKAALASLEQKQADVDSLLSYLSYAENVLDLEE
jgi:hypothetical protein